MKYDPILLVYIFLQTEKNADYLIQGQCLPSLHTCHILSNMNKHAKPQKSQVLMQSIICIP